MEREKACCFTGHRMIKKDKLPLIKELLLKEVERLIKKGIDTFYFGGAIGFDLLSANVVLFYKKKYPHIKLIFVKPCDNQSEKWDSYQKRTYEEITSQADEVILIAREYTIDCMKKRNQYMVDNSAYCIAYLINYRSGTSSTVQYAKSQNSDVIFINDVRGI